MQQVELSPTETTMAVAALSTFSDWPNNDAARVLRARLIPHIESGFSNVLTDGEFALLNDCIGEYVCEFKRLIGVDK